MLTKSETELDTSSDVLAGTQSTLSVQADSNFCVTAAVNPSDSYYA
jgi:hypothetical protein